MGHTPHPKQQRFLLHAETRELFFGGAGGGGKSQAAWYGALQFVETPGYAALIFRRTYADLALPKALMARSKAYLANTAAVWNETQKTWTFPSGATITFAYLENENDKYRYASAEFQYIFFDELTHFTETQYTFLFSRLRKEKVGPIADVPLRMRSASNPGGRGHDWVKKRFVDEETRQKNRVFIPAKMEDNPTLDQEEYRESLSNTDPLTRKQIEDGNWNAVEGGRFKKDWFYDRYTTQGDYLILRRGNVEDAYTIRWQECQKFGTVDPATSEDQKADYTVIAAWLLTPRGDLVWWDCDRGQLEIPDQLPRLQSFYNLHRLAYVGIEAVASNQALFQFANRTNMIATPLRPLGQDKLVRATQAMILAEVKRVWLPAPGARPGFPLDDVLGELLRFTGDEKTDDHDDVVDALAYAAKLVSEGPTHAERQARPTVYGTGYGYAAR